MSRPAPIFAETTAASASDNLRDEIEAIIARHAAIQAGFKTSVNGLQVARIVEPVPPTTHLAEACMCICVRGSRTLTVTQGTYAQAEDRFLLSAVGLPSIVAIEQASPANPYSALRIDFDLDLARQVMADIDIEGVSSLEPETGLSFGVIEPGLLDAVARLVRLIETPKEASFMADLIHREILYRLLSGPSGYRLRQIVRLGSQGHRIAKAVTWLRAHFREPLTINRLASAVGMGVSTLHRHFHEVTGMSPIQYQKQLRLHEARRLMLEEEVDVGSTALKVGYESGTQFIREYRRLFGNPPLRDVRALRSGGGKREAL